MAVPTITDLPTPPSRRRPQTFSNEADAWNAAFPQWTDETNALGEYVEQRAVDADNRATDSENARDASQEAQGLSEDARDLSLQYRNESEGFKDTAEVAAAAAGAAAGLPSLAGNALKKLGVKAGEDGVEWQEVETGVALYQQFTTSGTFTKDPDAEFIYVEVIGAGGSGRSVVSSSDASSSIANGGEGGSLVTALFRASDLPNSVPVVVGSGGVAPTVSDTAPNVLGQNGGDSSFADLTARGGYGAGNNPAMSGTLFQVRATTQLWQNRLSNGGIGAGRYHSTATGGDIVPASINGGDGATGGGASTEGLPAESLGSNQGGKSLYGLGDGGNGITAGNVASGDTSGGIPGGGGGGLRRYTTGGNARGGSGGRGEVRVYQF